MTRIKKPKTVRLTIIIDQELYKTATELCGFTDEEIKAMLSSEGTHGLRNYCNASENWIDNEE